MSSDGGGSRIASQFQGCQFSLLQQQPLDGGGGPTTTKTATDTTSATTTTTTSTTPVVASLHSFYLDSAGRVQLPLPLQLSFPTAEALQTVLDSHCIQPPPPPPASSSSSTTTTNTEEKDGSTDKSSSNNNNNNAPITSSRNSLSVEARVTMTFGTGEAISVTVESVTIESTRVIHNNNDNAVTGATALGLQVLANLRVARQGEIVSSVDGVKVNMELFAVLTEKENISMSSSSSSSSSTTADAGTDKKTSKPTTNTATKKAMTTTTHSLSSSSIRQERQSLAMGLRDLYFGRLQTVTSSSSSWNTSTSTTTTNTNTNATTTTAMTTTTRTVNAEHVLTKVRLASPILCRVSLDHALKVQARSMNGPTLGETWIALHMAHSNTHSSPVTITNVTLHTAFSKPKTSTQELSSSSAPSSSTTTLQSSKLKQQQDNNSVDATAEAVVDMSQNVHWRFLQETDDTTTTATTNSSNNNDKTVLKFPKTLQRHEAYSTVLHVTAGEDLVSRSFSCPISITATIHDDDDDDNNDGSQKAAEDKKPPHSSAMPLAASSGIEIVSVVPGEWTSAKRPIAPSDSFRVDVTLPDPDTVVVGQIFDLSLSVYNLAPYRRSNVLVQVVVSNDRNNNPQHNTTATTTTTTTTTTSDDITFHSPNITALVLGENDDDDDNNKNDDLAGGEEKKSEPGKMVSSGANKQQQLKQSSSSSSKHQLLAVDDSCHVGMMESLQSVPVKLRFIPLRAGALSFPTFQVLSLPDPPSSSSPSSPSPLQRSSSNVSTTTTKATKNTIPTANKNTITTKPILKNSSSNITNNDNNQAGKDGGSVYCCTHNLQVVAKA